MTVAALDTDADITLAHTPTPFFYDVTPELAAEWLDTRNVRNRHLTGDRSSEYAEQIKAGEWAINGDTIRFSRPVDDQPPMLLDGQHRLDGIRRSGLTVQCLLVTGLEPESQDTMDQGTVRSGSQVLAMHGYSDTQHLRAAAQLSWGYTRGLLARRTARERRAPANVLVGFVSDHQESLPAAVRQGRALQHNHAGSPGTSGAAYWIIDHAAPGRAAAYWGDLLDGGGHGEGHPVWTMRRALVNEAKKKRKTESRIVVAWHLICWNAYNTDREINFLSWRAESQPFPRAVEVSGQDG